MANHLDLSAAWHAHAPPPPPLPSPSPSPSPSKPRRRASYDPAAHGFDPHTQGGVLPPDSFSPEPTLSRSRTSSNARPDPTSIFIPSSPVKRHRTRIASSVAPPAPSALYNFKHQQSQHQSHQLHQRQQQQQQRQHPQYQPQQYHVPPHQAPPSSHRYAVPAGDGAAGYTRPRHDSSPYPMTAAAAASSPHQPAYMATSPGQQTTQLPPTSPATYASMQGYAQFPQPGAQSTYAQPPYHSHHQQQQPPPYPNPHPHAHQAQAQPYAAPPAAEAGWEAFAGGHPYALQQQQQPQRQQTANAPSHFAQPSSTYYTTPSQQHSATFSNSYVPDQQQQPMYPDPLTSAVFVQGAQSPAQVGHHAFPSMAQPSGTAAPAAAPPPIHGAVPPQVFSPPPTHPTSAYESSLSRQSTVSSVASTRRPLPQPTRTTSLTSAPSSPLAGEGPAPSVVGSVRRGLPRVPPSAGAHASGAASPPSVESPQGSPKLPLSTLNRTESVRLAAEALMARGVPQRRPLRSALRNSIFASPQNGPGEGASQQQQQLMGAASAAAISASQSEPVAQAPGSHYSHVAAAAGPIVGAGGEPSPSQSAGPGIPSADPQHQWAGCGTVRAQAAPTYLQGQLQQPQQPQQPQQLQQSQQSQPSTSQPPASYQSAVEQTQRQALPRQPQSQPQDQTQPSPRPASLADSFAQMSVRGHGRDAATASTGSAHSAPSQQAAPSISFAASPCISITEDEDREQPRRRGGSVSRSRQRAPSPSRTPAASSAIPTISFPDDDDGDDAANGGPVINISGPDDAADKGGIRKGSDVPSISIVGGDDENDDGRSQASASSRGGPSVSISFSGTPVGGAKPQQAKTTEASPRSHAGPYSGRNSDHGAASSSSVGGGAQCFACRKYIAGKVVHALETTFHPACFVCVHCSEGLEHVAFYEKDGLPYCHFDFHEQFSRRCFHCRTPIVDERYITVQDEELTGGGGEKERCYHELHFFCANCGDPFLDPKAAGSAAGADPSLIAADEDGRVKAGGMEFIVHKGYPYCEKCHINLHKPRCKKCRLPVTGDLVTALKAKYHPECFVCERCNRPFQDTSFFVSNGKAYDEECYKVILRAMV